jgi:uncharacterized membrane protein
MEYSDEDLGRGRSDGAMVDRDEEFRLESDSELTGEVSQEREGELSRVISLSDGVFAFAMTLLIVSVDVPKITDAEAKDHLYRHIFDLWPQILSYLIGFLVIGSLWSAHRRIYARVRDYDDRLIKLNVVLLMLIAFLPFATGVLGEYGNIPSSTILYSLILASIAMVFILILDHLDRNRALLTRDGAGIDFGRAKLRHLVTAGIFLLSVLAALVLPGYAQIWWILLAFNSEITERIAPYVPAPFGIHDQS